MAAEDKMTIDERFKYLRLAREQYKSSDRKKRSQLLDQMEAITGLHRKSLIRHMNGSLKRKPRLRQRSRTYGADVDDALRVIDESFDHICADRLTPNLVWMAEHLAAHGELEITSDLLEKLSRISISTVKRILRRIRQDKPWLKRRRSGRSVRMTQGVPMKRIPWHTQEPGHFEVDLVHHCGPSASGEYVCTIQMVDVATGWSERFAVLGRSYRVMENAFRAILARLPFPVLEIHPDNGSEFFNAHLLSFWRDKVQGVQLSRSRPYQKNDNRIVEQKNASLIRQYLSNDRLDTVAQVLALNEVYVQMGLYYNLFQPVMHLLEKTWCPSPDGHAGHMKRRFDDASTPFDRLCQTAAIKPEGRQALLDLRQQINPRVLRQQFYNAIDAIFLLPEPDPGKTENVFKTLGVVPTISIGDGTPVTLSFDRTTILR